VLTYGPPQPPMSGSFKTGSGTAPSVAAMTRMVTKAALAAAQDFLWRTGRLIDRHRFAYHFGDGSREQVLAALRPYRNDDGGFGNGLEPDLRGPLSQPQPVEVALAVLAEVDAGETDEGAALARDAAGYLASISTADGGVPFVLPSVRAHPRAPWWETPDDPPGNLNPTAPCAGLLYRLGVDHPWRDQATAFSWDRIERLGETNPYEMHAVLRFLELVDDRDRAEEAIARVGPKLAEQGLVTLDPHAGGEVHRPLDYAASPDAPARRFFDDATLAAHLDALVAAQQEDGGWTVDFPAWTPAAGLEWRAWQTLSRLLTLRAYGRLE
jgi:hypothetical protein